MQFFFSVIQRQHVFIPSEEFVVSALELLDEMELVVLPCEEGDEVSLDLGEIGASCLLLACQGLEDSAETGERSGFYAIPDICHLLDEDLIEFCLSQS